MATAAGSPESLTPTASTPLVRPPAARPLGPDLLRAEWTKLHTVRSTWWALSLTVASMVGLGALFCARYGIGGISPAERTGVDPAAYRLGSATLVRSTVGATAVVVGLVFILPGIVGALPSAWERTVTPYLPSNAGQALIGRTKFAPQGLHLLSPWAGFAVVSAYAAAGLLAAAVILRRRDA